MIEISKKIDLIKERPQQCINNMTFTFDYLLGDKIYPVIVTYKNKKNISYRFKNGQFIVYSPYLVSKKRIEQGLVKFAPSLIKRSEVKLGKGDDFIYIFGHKVSIYDSGEITFNSGRVITYKNREDLDKKLRIFFKEIVTSRVRYYENIMSVPSYNVKVREMTSRYGSNSKKTKSVCFSIILIHYDISIIDSVVVHELAHYYAFDHSKKFYDVVYKYYPNYDVCHTKLRKGIFQ